jgi:hypothetical protein
MLRQHLETLPGLTAYQFDPRHVPHLLKPAS